MKKTIIDGQLLTFTQAQKKNLRSSIIAPRRTRTGIQRRRVGRRGGNREAWGMPSVVRTCADSVPVFSRGFAGAFFKYSGKVVAVTESGAHADL